MKTNLLIFLLGLCIQLKAKNSHEYIPNLIVNGDHAEHVEAKFKAGSFNSQSLGFTENKGQVYGYDGLAHPEVKYILQEGGVQIFLTEKGIVYQFTKIHYKDDSQAIMADSVDRRKFGEFRDAVYTETYRMDMSLLGASNHCEISTEGKSFDYINFYTYDILNVHSFTKITYHGIYPGIDWVIYIKNGEVKYDFVVQPNANASVIQLQFNYQESLDLNADGSICLSNTLGRITEKKPISVQGQENIQTNYIVRGNTISFELSKYNHQQSLIIDPAVFWATYYGASGNDSGSACSTDASGNIYLGGATLSSYSIASGGHQNNYGGVLYDAFLVKFNSNGVRQWATYYGGTDDDRGNSCAIDFSGNVYLAGETKSASGIASGGHQNALASSNYDSFLVKFDSDGIRQWATYYGGTGNDNGYSCSIDLSGNIYMAGETTSLSDIASGGYQNVFAGGSYDAFLVKFDSTGTRQWATYCGGTGDDYGQGCSTDASGNIYLTGETTSPSDITSGGHQNTFGGGFYDAFLVKLSTNGVRGWATYYGGTGYDSGRSCSTDALGNIYLAGNTRSSSGIASGGYQNTFAGITYDAFLVKFNTTGVRQWATYYGGTGDDYGISCITDGSDNVCLVGRTTSSFDIALGGHQNTYAGATDAFLVKFTSGGLRQWATYYGGTGSDGGQSCATDASGNIYLAGYSESLSGISSNGHQNVYGGGEFDAFLVKFSVLGYATEATEYLNSSANSEISVFPNPSRGEFFIETINAGLVVIYNAFGQMVLSMELESGKQHLTMSGLEDGIYFLQYTEKLTTRTAKIVVQR